MDRDIGGHYIDTHRERRIGMSREKFYESVERVKQYYIPADCDGPGILWASRRIEKLEKVKEKAIMVNYAVYKYENRVPFGVINEVEKLRQALRDAEEG